jgi:biopolymer transport protein ExbB
MFEQFDWLATVRTSPIMLALVVCAVLTVGYALERLVYFAVRGGSADEALSLASSSLRAGNEEEALRVLNKCSHPFGSVALVMLSVPGAPTEAVEEKLQIALSRQRLQLERHLGLIGTLGRTTPLIGLLGTVWGTMRALHEMAKPGIGGSSLLASGVAEALLTTAAGLLIAVPALFLFNSYTRHVGNQLTVAENHARMLRLEAEAARGARSSERAA